MGKVKAWAMELEEEFLDTASNTVGECESFDEFVGKMQPHFNKLKHMSTSEIHDLVGEAWGEYWSRYI